MRNIFSRYRLTVFGITLQHFHISPMTSRLGWRAPGGLLVFFLEVGAIGGFSELVIDDDDPDKPNF